ncbi:hypothetical protein ACFSLT_16015 [Novosphingobium resinovorum]
MEDRSQAGRDAYAATLRKGLAQIEAFDAKGSTTPRAPASP